MEFYQQRFANAADFTYFFVGAFKVDEIAPLLATYIGALPSTGKPTSKRGDLRMQFPTTVVKEAVNRGQEPRSQTAITFFADTGIDEMEDHRLRRGGARVTGASARHPARAARWDLFGRRRLQQHVARAGIRHRGGGVRQLAGERRDADGGGDEGSRPAAT